MTQDSARQKRLKFMTAYASTGNVKLAAKAGGITDGIARRTLEGDFWSRDQDILTAFEKAGATLEAAAEAVAACLTAKKTLMMPDGEGGVISREVDDFGIRLAAAKLVIAVNQGVPVENTRPELVPVILSADEFLGLSRREQVMIIMERTVQQQIGGPSEHGVEE